MEDKLAKLYNELANEIVAMIPTNFEDVYCMCEIEEGGRGRTITFYFKDSKTKAYVKSYDIPNTYNVSQQVYKELEAELFSILDKIYSIFIESEQELWTLLEMYFDNQGGFKIEFVYDSIDYEKYDYTERCVIWAYKKIGFTYKEGTYHQKIIDKYIKSNKED